jgi:hypothetical protein
MAGDDVDLADCSSYAFPLVLKAHLIDLLQHANDVTRLNSTNSPRLCGLSHQLFVLS